MTLVYEGGEASRFDEEAIRVGTNGVRRVLASLGILADEPPPPRECLLSRRSRWARAPSSGIAHLKTQLGSRVSKGDTIASIVDPFGKRLSRITARHDGMVIGHTQHPLVNQGDAVAHIAEV